MKMTCLKCGHVRYCYDGISDVGDAYVCLKCAGDPPERWLPIAGHDGWYDVSDLGRLRSWYVHGRNGVRADSPSILKPRMGVWGYWYAPVHKTRRPFLHTLVLETFVGPRPDRMVGRHLDGDRANACLDNLVWGSRRENIEDRIRHGTLVPAKPIETWKAADFYDPFVPFEAVVPWEVWKTPKGYVGYEVSSFGGLRTYRRAAQGGLSDTPKPLTPKVSARGYLYARLRSSDGKGVALSLGRLVLDAFSSPVAKGDECRHLDGDSSNNHIRNLRWSTHRDNIADRAAHGTENRGERNGESKLNADKVLEIRRRLAEGEGPSAIARELEMSPSTISQIGSRRLWRHV